MRAMMQTFAKAIGLSNEIPVVAPEEAPMPDDIARRILRFSDAEVLLWAACGWSFPRQMMWRVVKLARREIAREWGCDVSKWTDGRTPFAAGGEHE